MIDTWTQALTLMLSIFWGIYLVHTSRDFLRARRTVIRGTRATSAQRVAIIATFRRLVVALCVFSLPFGVFVRSFATDFGLQSELSGAILFFVFAGTNLPGSLFCALTVLKPEWFD